MPFTVNHVNGLWQPSTESYVPAGLEELRILHKLGGKGDGEFYTLLVTPSVLGPPGQHTLSEDQRRER